MALDRLRRCPDEVADDFWPRKEIRRQNQQSGSSNKQSSKNVLRRRIKTNHNGGRGPEKRRRPLDSTVPHRTANGGVWLRKRGEDATAERGEM